MLGDVLSAEIGEHDCLGTLVRHQGFDRGVDGEGRCGGRGGRRLVGKGGDGDGGGGKAEGGKRSKLHGAVSLMEDELTRMSATRSSVSAWLRNECVECG